jgi:hypothetical protein
VQRAPPRRRSEQRRPPRWAGTGRAEA